jgi:hypothetical protein
METLIGSISKRAATKPLGPRLLYGARPCAPLSYANPVSASFGAALHSAVVTTLQSRGHEVDDCDLYAEGFNPVMREQERMQYHDVELNRAPPSRPLPIGCWRPRRLYSSIRVRNPSNRLWSHPTLKAACLGDVRGSAPAEV